MGTRQITFTARHLDGSLWSYADVRFTLKEAFSSSLGINPGETWTVTADVNGYGTITLATPDSGTAHYVVQLPDQIGRDAYISAGPAADLAGFFDLASNGVGLSWVQGALDAHTASAATHAALLAGTAFMTAVQDVLGSWAMTGSEMITNGDFETAGAGGADVFGWWNEAAGSGSITRDTSVFRNVAASCKLVAGAGTDTYVYTAAITVVPGETYIINIPNRGDGTYHGRVMLYDVTHSAFVNTSNDVSNTTTTWQQELHVFTVPAGCTSFQIFLFCPGTNGGTAWFDDVSMKQLIPGAKFVDNFAQADGQLLRSTSNWPWETQYTNNVGDPILSGGRMDLAPGGTGLAYAYLNAPAVPVIMTCKVIWKNDAAGAGSTAAIVCSKTGNRDWTDLVHFLFDTAGWTLQTRTGGGGFTTLANAALSLVAGTEYTFSIALSGNTATLTFPGGTQAVTDASIGALKGRYLYWEITRTGATLKTPTLSWAEARW